MILLYKDVTNSIDPLLHALKNIRYRNEKTVTPAHEFVMSFEFTAFVRCSFDGSVRKFYFILR